MVCSHVSLFVSACVCTCLCGVCVCVYLSTCIFIISILILRYVSCPCIFMQCYVWYCFVLFSLAISLLYIHGLLHAAGKGLVERCHEGMCLVIFKATKGPQLGWATPLFLGSKKRVPHGTPSFHLFQWDLPLQTSHLGIPPGNT